jgi:hypothetical protein
MALMRVTEYRNIDFVLIALSVSYLLLNDFTDYDARSSDILIVPLGSCIQNVVLNMVAKRRL